MPAGRAGSPRLSLWSGPGHTPLQGSDCSRICSDGSRREARTEALIQSPGLARGRGARSPLRKRSGGLAAGGPGFTGCTEAGPRRCARVSERPAQRGRHGCAPDAACEGCPAGGW